MRNTSRVQRHDRGAAIREEARVPRCNPKTSASWIPSPYGRDMKSACYVPISESMSQSYESLQ